MIKINLMPGSAKRSTRKAPKVPLGPLPKIKGLPPMNRAAVIMAVCWVAGLGLTGYLFFGHRARKAELKLEIEAARADSVRLHALIQSKQRIDSTLQVITERLNVVQQIDANRYVWAHILDEVSRALPEHTWFTHIDHLAPDSGQTVPKFMIEGRTGNNFALTRFLEQLEVSPFIRGVRLRSSALVREDERYIYSFHVEASYERPAADVIETRPFFAIQEDSSTTDAVPPAAEQAAAPAAAVPVKTASRSGGGN